MPGRSPVLLALAVLGVSCATARGPAPDTPSPAASPSVSGPAVSPAPVLPASIHWFRNSAEYRAIARQTYSLAGRRLEAVVAGRPTGTWGVIVDADETVLDNSEYQKERELRGLRFTPESWREWVARRAAGVVPGAREYLQQVHTLGGRIAVVTNRTAEECPDTQANFRALVLPYDAMLCKPAGGRGEKDSRFAQVATGQGTDLPPLEVVMFVGDNILDFPGGSQDLRTKPVEAYGLLGDRYFLLPNPMYGSWERNPQE